MDNPLNFGLNFFFFFFFFFLGGGGGSPYQTTHNHVECYKYVCQGQTQNTNQITEQNQTQKHIIFSF